MKLALNQLKNHLQTGLQSVYIIMTDELLLQLETVNYLRKVSRQHDFHEFERYQITPQFNWAPVMESSQSLSLFSSKKLIELNITNGKPGRDGAGQLLELISTEQNDTVFIITLPKLNKTSQKAKWFSELLQHGVLIEIPVVTRKNLPQWFAKRLQRHQLSTDQANLELMADYCENNLLAAKQLVERLTLLANDTMLNQTDIIAALGDDRQFDVFTLTDAILAEQCERSQTILHNLIATGTEAGLLLFLLAKECRTLLKLKQQPQLDTQTWRQLGIWQNKQRLYQQHLQHFSLTDYQYLLSLAHQADCALKGLSQRDIWQVIEELVLGMSNAKLCQHNQRLSA